MYNNNLTAQHQQQQQQQQQQQPQPQPDIYALLSTDDTVEIDESIDADALVMDIFDSFTPNTAPSPAVRQIHQLRYDEHRLSSNGSSANNSVDSNSAFPTPTSTVSSTTNEFGLNQDILGNFDITSNNQQQQQTQQQQQQQYTPSSSSDICIDPIFSFSFPEQDSIFPSFDPPPPTRSNIDFTRRHSVAVSGISDFNIRNLSQNYQSTSQSTFNNNTYAVQTPPQNQTQSTTLPQQLAAQQQQSQQQQLFNKQAPFLSQKTVQHLATVVEGESPSNMGHRASMPNIFLSEESRRKLNNSIQQRNSSLSARTTPNNTPPPVSLDFNQMPWSNTSNNSIPATTEPNHIKNEFHDTNSPQFHEWNPSNNAYTSHPPSSQAPVTTVEDRPFTGRKRFYSQQFASFPTPSQHRIMPFNQTSYRQLQQPPGSSSSSSSLCPLPMSGIVSRRASVATPHDISAWNRMVNPNDRILLEQKEQPSHKRGGDEEPAAKRLREDDGEFSENTSVSGSILSTENNGPREEDYPVITDADLEAAKKDPNAIPRRQKLRFDEDEYTPKWVRYTGQSKEGYCDTCKPGKWLQLKNSAYWYHKQFYHGISSVSGKIFQRPLEQRAGEHDVIEGLCHQCKQFVPICNSKRKNSVLWFRHAHKCHVYDKPKTKGGKRASISVPTTKRHQLNEQLQKIY